MQLRFVGVKAGLSAVCLAVLFWSRRRPERAKWIRLVGGQGGRQQAGGCLVWCCKNCPSLPEINTLRPKRNLAWGAGQSGTWQLLTGMLIGLQGSWLQAFRLGCVWAGPLLFLDLNRGLTFTLQVTVWEEFNNRGPSFAPAPTYTCTVTLLYRVVVCQCITRAHVGISRHCSNLIALPPAHHQPK